jgi:hypothetical protein
MGSKCSICATTRYVCTHMIWFITRPLSVPNNFKKLYVRTYVCMYVCKQSRPRARPPGQALKNASPQCKAQASTLQARSGPSKHCFKASQAHAGLVFGLSPQSRPRARPPGQARKNASPQCKARSSTLQARSGPSKHWFKASPGQVLLSRVRHFAVADDVVVDALLHPILWIKSRLHFSLIKTLGQIQRN